MILIPKTMDDSNGFWTSLTEGCKLGAQEYGIDLQVLGGQSEEDIETQNQCIEEAISRQPDAILVAPCSYSQTTAALQKVVDSKIKLILIDSVIDRDIADGIVATDNNLAGQELGKYAKTLLKAKGEIGIVAHVKGASTAIEREKGIREGLGEEESRVQDVVYCDSSYNRAYELTSAMLEQYPDLQLIIGTNEYSAVGAARAVKQFGRAGEIKVVGFDNSVEEIQLMEEGVFQGIIIQKPFNMGYLGIQQAVNAVKGREISRNLDSGYCLITPENMYNEENQRLLYPFSGRQ